MGVEFDFSDVDGFFEKGYEEVIEKEKSIADEAVQYAKDNGNYKDHTGNLRAANKGDADEEGIILKNDMEYASYVESKGFEVLESAALYAEKRAKEEFE